MNDEYKSITKEEVINWTSNGFFTSQEGIRDEWLKQILTGEYDLNKAREDILSFRKKNEDDEE